MRLRPWLLVLVAAALFAPGRAEAAFEFGFKTPGGAAYCQLEVENSSANAFRCFTPNDGWWIRFNRINGNSPTVSKGYSARYRDFHPTGASLLAFGKDWHSSDADAVVCRSRSNGLTCKTYSGLSFWIGRYKGYRIFYDTPGEHPNVKPLFRTATGVWCGINLNNFEPAVPGLALLASGHGTHSQPLPRLPSIHRASGSCEGLPPGRVQSARGRAFPLWRCRKIDAAYAENCSSTSGTPVSHLHERIEADLQEPPRTGLQGRSPRWLRHVLEPPTVRHRAVQAQIKADL